MLNPTLIGSFFVLIPIWAFVIWRIRLEPFKFWLIIALIMSTVLFFYSLGLTPVQALELKITRYFFVYALGFIVYLLLFSHKFKYHYFNRVLAISLLTLFISADLWEYGVFIWALSGHPHFTRWLGQWTDHIHRSYVIGAAMLLIWLENLDTRDLWAFIPVCLFGSTLLLLVPAGGVWARIFVIMFFGLAIYYAIPDRRHLI